MLKRWFHRTVLSRRWLTFLVMGLSFFVFGAGTVNIFMLFKANAELIASYGWQALMDGAARQFAELLHTLPERLRPIESFDLNIEALSDANVAGHAVSAVDAATWQVASSADISGPD